MHGRIFRIGRPCRYFVDYFIEWDPDHIGRDDGDWKQNQTKIMEDIAQIIKLGGEASVELWWEEPNPEFGIDAPPRAMNAITTVSDPTTLVDEIALLENTRNAAHFSVDNIRFQIPTDRVTFFEIANSIGDVE